MAVANLLTIINTITLIESFKVKAEILAVDFGSEDQSFYEDIKSTIENKCEPVGILGTR